MIAGCAFSHADGNYASDQDPRLNVVSRDVLKKGYKFLLDQLSEQLLTRNYGIVVVYRLVPINRS